MKQKRKLTAAEKAAKKQRKREFETIFINGRMKRVRRPQMIGGMSVEEFVVQNTDPLWAHQNEMWELIEIMGNRDGHHSSLACEREDNEAQQELASDRQTATRFVVG